MWRERKAQIPRNSQLLVRKLNYDDLAVNKWSLSCDRVTNWPHPLLFSLCFVSTEAIKSVMIKNKTLPINTNNFTLICEVDGPYDMIYWRKNGQRLGMNTSDSDMHYHIKDNLLHFTPVTLGSEGKYECEAVNRAAEHSSPKYTLLVMCEYCRKQ